MTHDVSIETRRLRLRELREADMDDVHAYARDSEVVRHLDWGPNTEANTAEFLATARAARDTVPRTTYHLAIVVESGERLIGGCRIEVRNAANGAGDLGYVLARKSWGHGYATEAGQALLTFGFERLGLHRIWATCDVENRASVRVLEKLGMQREGHLRQNVRRKGAWRDSYLYAILEPEWRRELAGDRPGSTITAPPRP
jgi:[ribosomal protein S5]-alanine N-acetyltransferase